PVEQRPPYKQSEKNAEFARSRRLRASQHRYEHQKRSNDDEKNEHQRRNQLELVLHERRAGEENTIGELAGAQYAVRKHERRERARKPAEKPRPAAWSGCSGARLKGKRETFQHPPTITLCAGASSG